MTTRITHQKVSAKVDGTDATEVLPSDWNATHALATDNGGGMVLGRDTSGPGAIQELPFQYDGLHNWVLNSTGTLLLPKGTIAQRPSGAVAGMIRYNSDTQQFEGFGVGGSGSWSPLGAPSGTLAAFPLAPPPGWFACNGQAISRTTNPALFTYIGTAFGAGDGSTTFNVPNYIDRVLVMAGGTYALGVTRGAFSNNIGVPLLQHSHGLMNNFNETVGFPQPVDSGQGGAGAGSLLAAEGAGRVMLSTTQTGDPGAFITAPTEQPGVGVNIAIRGG